MGSTIWFVYTEMNSPLNVGLNVFEIDTEGTIWIATERCGLLKFDGKQWTAYTHENSNLPDNTLILLAIDGYGNKWIKTQNGIVVKFDSTDWTIYNTNNTKILKAIYNFAIDKQL